MELEFDLKEYWNEVLEELSGKVSAISFDVWIKTLKPEYTKGNILVLSSPSASSQKLVIKNYKNIICEALTKTNRGFSDVEILVEDQVEKPKAEEKVLAAEEEKPKESQFNPRLTFDNFVVGSCNQFAVAAAKAVCDEPGKSYNPLFVYGGVGLGKTHLLHAIGNQLEKERPDLNVVYTTTEKFTNELISAIQTNRRASEAEFRKHYRNADVLIVDDIQFIISKTSTQEEFFNTFNELIQKGKQVVISSDKPPKDINPLEERLRSRFEWGLLADIGYPDIETKIAILNKKAQLERCNVSPEAIAYIAERSNSSIRVMEGYFARTVFGAKIQGRSYATLDDAVEALKNAFSAEEQSDEDSDIEAVIDAVCRYFNISKTDLLSSKRQKEIAEARQICMYIACEHTKKYPLSYIGAMFKRDHSTVIHAREKIKQDIRRDRLLKTKIEDIKNMVRGI